jgi:hypothetical protein
VALTWAAVAFVATQVGLAAAADCLAPELYDPEYAARLDRLRRERDRHPDRPLAVVLGSSRAAVGFRPERLPPLHDRRGRRVTPFNFAHMGAGPVYARMTYDRLAREGLAPDWVVLELTPTFLADEWKPTYTGAATAADLGLVRRYAPGGLVYPDYLRRRLLPAYTHRRALLWRLAPGWEMADPAAPDRNLGELGGEQGRLPAALPPAEREAAFGRAASVFGPPLQAFRVTPAADGAVRDLIADCRRRGVPVTLLLAPEATQFRALYPPAALATLDQFVRGLTREPGVTLTDAREWLPDDLFTDGHHVLLPGQEAFTDRFGREALRPLVTGESGGR